MDSIATNRILRVLYTVNPGSFSQNAPELVDLMMETLPNTLRPLFYNVMQYAKRTQLVLTDMPPEQPEVKIKLLSFLDKEISVTQRLSWVKAERKNDLVTVLRNLKEVLTTSDDGMIMPCCLLAKIACDRELNQVTDLLAQAAEHSLLFFGADAKIVVPKSRERFMNDIGRDYCPWIEGVTQKNTELFRLIHWSLFHSSSKLNPGHVITMYMRDIENYLTMQQSQDLVISSGPKK